MSCVLMILQISIKRKNEIKKYPKLMTNSRFFEQNTNARDMMMKFLEPSELDVDFVPKKFMSHDVSSGRSQVLCLRLIFVTIKILFFDFQEKSLMLAELFTEIRSRVRSCFAQKPVCESTKHRMLWRKNFIKKLDAVFVLSLD